MLCPDSPDDATTVSVSEMLAFDWLQLTTGILASSSVVLKRTEMISKRLHYALCSGWERNASIPGVKKGFTGDHFGKDETLSSH